MSDVVDSLKEELRKHNCPSEREMLSSRFNRDSFLQLNEDKERILAFRSFVSFCNINRF